MLGNYRAGVMERLGVGWDVLRAANPRLIHCSITGFGTSGPYSARPSYDNVALALSGMASLLLDPDTPQVCGPTITDNASGMYACYGILGALYERELKEYGGRRVEVNMLEAAISFIPDPFASYTRMGVENKPAHARCQLPFLRLAMQRWQDARRSALVAAEILAGVLRCVRAAELIDDERFATRDLRIKNYVELTRLLGEKHRDEAAGALDGGTRSQRRAICAGAHH